MSGQFLLLFGRVAGSSLSGSDAVQERSFWDFRNLLIFRDRNYFYAIRNYLFGYSELYLSLNWGLNRGCRSGFGATEPFDATSARTLNPPSVVSGLKHRVMG